MRAFGRSRARRPARSRAPWLGIAVAPGAVAPGALAPGALAMGALAMGALAMGLAGCGDTAAPAVPTPEGGRPDRRHDGGGLDAPDGPERPDGGPRLPPSDLELVLPYMGAMGVVPLEVAAAPGQLDVHFSIDTTGSFGEEIDALQRDLLDLIVPTLEERVDDVAFGVSRFEDFPAAPFGQPSDRPFELLSPITGDRVRVGRGVALLDAPLGAGGDIPEAGSEALWQIATGEGFPAGQGDVIEPYDRRAAPGGGSRGGVGFREGALATVIHVTDAPPHRPADYQPLIEGVHSLEEAIEALSQLGIRVLGIASGGHARAHLERVALSTGASIEPTAGRCLTGIGGAAHAPVAGRCPLVFDIREDGTGLSRAIVDAIAALVLVIRYDEVYGAAVDDALGFVRAIAATGARPPSGAEPPRRADRRPPGDGLDDTFVDVASGTTLSFEARLKNETLPPAPDYDQSFRIRIQVRGDGQVLEEKVVRVIVPRAVPSGGPDSGAVMGADGGPDASGRIDASARDASADAPSSEAGPGRPTDAGEPG